MFFLYLSSIRVGVFCILLFLLCKPEISIYIYIRDWGKKKCTFVLHRHRLCGDCGVHRRMYYQHCLCGDCGYTKTFVVIMHSRRLRGYKDEFSTQRNIWIFRITFLWGECGMQRLPMYYQSHACFFVVHWAPCLFMLRLDSCFGVL